ncbi:nucleolar transcription factor 1-like [Oscarella lobularis]|uniref:nucleolar transcription factor 1-like n=1 Tax=Oscarella lobularis TaxID=121494 RepID=UPI003313F58B
MLRRNFVPFLRFRIDCIRIFVSKSTSSNECADTSLKETLKRPPNSFILFSQDVYEELKREHPDLKRPQLMSLMATKYKKLSESEKERYKNMSKSLRAKFEVEKGPVLRKLGGPTRKRSATPYGLFWKDLFATGQLPRESISKLMAREVQQKWMNLKDDEKSKYFEMAQEDRDKHRAQKEAVFAKAESHKVKKPRNAFTLFVVDLNEAAQADIKGNMVTLASCLWKEMSSEAKGKYIKLAAEERERYKLQLLRNKET